MFFEKGFSTHPPESFPIAVAKPDGTPELDERELNLKFVKKDPRKANFLWGSAAVKIGWATT